MADKVLVDSINVKYHELRQRLTGRAASGVVAVRVECRLDCEAKLETTFNFLRIHAARINSELSGVLADDADVLAAAE